MSTQNQGHKTFSN